MNRTWVLSALLLASSLGCNRTRNAPPPPPPAPTVPSAASGAPNLGGLLGAINNQIGSAATAMGSAVGSANAAMASAASAMPTGFDPAAMASAQAAAAQAAQQGMPTGMDPAAMAAMASAQAAAAQGAQQGGMPQGFDPAAQAAAAQAAAMAGQQGAAPAGGATVIQVGATVAGTLTASDTRLQDGSVGDDYTVNLVAGAPITIIARGGPSMDTPGTNLDTYLLVLQGEQELTHDDDSAGNLNARIVFTPPATGPYTIRVTTFGSGLHQGAYTLSVMPGAHPDAT